VAELPENNPPKRGADTHRIVLVTGLSGAGKSTATKALEDLGFFCIDNLPVMLLPKLLELVSHGTSDEVQRLAIVIDAREGRFLDSMPAALDEVRREGHQLEVVFFDCAALTLLHRARRRVSECGGALGLVCVRPWHRKILAAGQRSGHNRQK